MARRPLGQALAEGPGARARWPVARTTRRGTARCRAPRVGVDGGVAVGPAARDLRRRDDDALAVGDGDGVGGQVHARSGPVAGDVLGLDRQDPGVGDLGVTVDAEDAVEVGRGDGAGPVALGERGQDVVGHDDQPAAREVGAAPGFRSARLAGAGPSGTRWDVGLTRPRSRVCNISRARPHVRRAPPPRPPARRGVHPPARRHRRRHASRRRAAAGRRGRDVARRQPHPGP